MMKISEDLTRKTDSQCNFRVHRWKDFMEEVSMNTECTK